MRDGQRAKIKTNHEFSSSGKEKEKNYIRNERINREEILNDERYPRILI